MTTEVPREQRAEVGRPRQRTRAWRWLAVVTVVLVVVPAVGLAAFGAPADRRFVMISGLVQILVSVTVAFFGVLLAADLRRRRRAASRAPLWRAAIVMAVGWALVGLLVSLLATALAPSAVPGRWAQLGVAVVGALLVQVTAMLVGTGLGLLIRSRLLAMLATIVLPLGLWLLLGAAGAATAQAWLTPYASAQRLLSGHLNSLEWVQCGVVLVIWGIGVNVLAIRWISSRRRSGTDTAATY